MDKRRLEKPRCEGYTLYSVPSPDALPGQHATLVDMNGEIVHEWSITGTPVRMLPGGSLLGNKSFWQGQETPPGEPPPATSRRQHDTIELIQEGWDGQEEWSFSNWDDAGTGIMMSRLHHDYEREGNPVGYYAPGQEFIDQGKTLILAHKNKVVPEIRGDKELIDDVIYEVGWDGNLIIISSRHANFIAIISRATGNVVWRVGPDFLESTPEHNLGQIVAQHHAHMIPKRLPGEGNILVFDNGGRSGYGGPTLYPRYTRDYSRVIEFNPVMLEIVWQYGAESGEEKFFSHYISAAQRLPNGNTLITEGANGRIFEVTPDKETVWEFTSPSMGTKGNAIYRAYRIPPEWVPGNPAGYDEWATLYE